MELDNAIVLYLQSIKGRVKTGTFTTEASCCSRITGNGESYNGRVLISEIGKDWAQKYQQNRLNKGIAPATINQEIAVLGKVIKHITGDNPIAGIKKLKVPKPHRQLLTFSDIDAICHGAPTMLQNYIRFLQYTGAREQEALRVRWQDIDYKNEIVCIGADGLAKNGKARYIHFSPQLKTLLSVMDDRNAPRSELLFQFTSDTAHRHLMEKFRGDKYKWVSFHDFRHYFTSQCVMSGIDFHTIAQWLGHSDSSLIAKRYAHLSSEYTKKQANRLKFN